MPYISNWRVDIWATTVTPRTREHSARRCNIFTLFDWRKFSRGGSRRCWRKRRRLNDVLQERRKERCRRLNGKKAIVASVSRTTVMTMGVWSCEIERWWLMMTRSLVYRARCRKRRRLACVLWAQRKVRLGAMNWTCLSLRQIDERSSTLRRRQRVWAGSLSHIWVITRDASRASFCSAFKLLVQAIVDCVTPFPVRRTCLSLWWVMSCWFLI